MTSIIYAYGSSLAVYAVLINYWQIQINMEVGDKARRSDLLVLTIAGQASVGNNIAADMCRIAAGGIDTHRCEILIDRVQRLYSAVSRLAHMLGVTFPELPCSRIR